MGDSLRPLTENPGVYYSPFLSGTAESNRENLVYFVTCLSLNIAFACIWNIVFFVMDYKKRCLRILDAIDDRFGALCLMSLLFCSAFLLVNMPGRVHGIHGELLVRNLFLYTFVYSNVCSIFIVTAALLITFATAVRSRNRKMMR